MKLKVCYYCGTKYAEDVERCPLCGQTEVEPEALDEVPAAVSAEPVEEVAARPAKEKKVKAEKPKKEREPFEEQPVVQRDSNGGAIAVCVILALIVLAGIAFILHSVGVFGGEGPKTPIETAPDSSLNLPVEPSTTDGELTCEAITVAPTSLNLGAEGIKTKLSVLLLPAGCKDPVTFTSSDEKIVTVTADGEVTSVGQGTATVTVTCGTQTAVVDVVCAFESTTPITPAPSTPSAPSTVTDWELKDVTLSTEDFTLFNVGETATIRLKGLPENKVVDVKWESSDSGIATVANGKVTAVASGKATVTATVGGKKLTCIVRCNLKDAPAAPQQPTTGDQPSTGDTTATTVDNIIKLRSYDVTFSREGEFAYNTIYRDNTRLVGENWTSADPGVCKVEVMADNSAKMTAVAPGTTTITVTYEGKTYECVVRCLF